MAFANVLMLFGLAAVAIPIILHVARRERPIRTELPTVEFLRRAVNRTRRRRRLQDWLLLAIRMLLVVLACLFFSRPSWRANPFAPADMATAAVVLVIDDAWYQGAKEGDGTRIELVRRHALAVLDRLAPGSRVALFTRSRDAGELTLDLDFVRRQITALEAEAAVDDLRTAIARAHSLLATSATELPGLIVVITDANAATLRPDAGPISAPEAELAVIRLPPRPADAWISPMQFPKNQQAVPNRPFPITVEVGGDAIPQDARVRLRADGRTVAEVPVPPGPGSRLVRFDFVPGTSGTQQLRTSLIAGDPIEIDNHSYATINVDPPARLAIVGAAGSGVASRDLIALAAAPPGWLGRQRYAVRVADPDQVANLQVDLAIVCGPRLPDANAWQTLLDSGCAILLWPDAAVTAETLNARLQPILRKSLARHDLQSPATIPPVDDTQLGPREPFQLNTWFGHSATAPPQSPPELGDYLIISATPANKRLIFCGIPFADGASDLLRLRDFAPFVHRLIAAAIGDARPSADVAVGEPARLPTPAGAQLSVRLPSGDRVPLAATIDDVATVGNTDLPGFYQLEMDGEAVAIFAADLPRPSALRRQLDDPALKQLLPENGQLLDEPATLTIPGKAGRRPLQLAPALLLAFILLLPLEGILSAAKAPSPS